MPRYLFSLFAGAVITMPLWLHASIAGAQSSANLASEPVSEKVRLVYRGPAGCPDAGAFRNAVARRLPTGWEASPEEPARRIDVVVQRRGDDYVATIELLDADGQLLRRAVRGRDCGDVVNGIALVTALAIESRIDEAFDQSEPATARASSAAAPATATSPNSGAARAPTGDSAGRAAPARPVAAPAPTSATAAPAPSENVSPSAPDTAGVPRHWRASLRGGFTSGIAPSFAPGLGVAGVLELGAARVGLSLFGFSSGRVTEAGVEARFELWMSRLEGCPIAVDLGAAMALEPCVSFEAGVLSGRGYADPPTVAVGQSGRSPWLAPGATARLVGSFGQLVVELQGDARLPLRREEFYVHSPTEDGGGTSTTVHEVAPIAFGAQVGVGLRF